MTAIEATGNVIRVTNQRSQGVYITYILRVLQGGPDKDGKEQPMCDSVTISAMGRAIHTAVNVAEIIKRRVVGLHQITSISSQTVDDSNAEDTGRKDTGARKASIITIQLSRRPLNTKDVGYQAPLPESMVTNEEAREARPPRSAQSGAERGGSRGGYSRGGARGGSSRRGRGGYSRGAN